MSQQRARGRLREWLDAVEAEGELERISGAHWEKEMGAISELIEQNLKREAPALLFDDIPGYPTGYRALFSHIGSPKRVALTFGLDPSFDHILDFVDDLDGVMSDPGRVPTETVGDGPVLENVRTGDEVDLTEVPAPLHHELDGGRYLGTADTVITEDLDSGWVNLGTYRAQLHSDDEIFLYISPGKHGRLHRDTYFERDEPMPVAMTFGQDPLLFLVSGTEAGMEVNELEYAGAIRGQPYEVIDGPVTGLPIPANAEVAIEGYLYPDQTAVEGPFGEWQGYYGSGAREEPFMTVEGMYFRDDPIVVCSPPHKPPSECTFLTSIMRTPILKKELRQAGIPNVVGVWRHEAGCSRLFNVVAIEQRYAGHARQAAYVAAQTRAGAYAGRWTVVVDEDVDPTDLDEVVWAMSTRCDPATDIEFIDRAWSTPLDVMVPDGEKEHPMNSRAIVDATVPYERREEFPPVAETSPEYREEIREKWGDTLPV